MHTYQIICIVVGSLIPLAALVSQFFGSHKKFTVGRVVTSILAFITGFLIASLLLFVWDWRDLTSALIVIVVSVIICAIVAVLQQDWLPNPKRWRTYGNWAGLGGIILLVSLPVIMWCYQLVAMSTAAEQASEWRDVLEGLEEQEYRNAAFTNERFEYYFGFAIPEFDVLEYQAANPGITCSAEQLKLRTKKPVTEEFLKQQVREEEYYDISYSDSTFTKAGCAEIKKITILPNNEILVEIRIDN